MTSVASGGVIDVAQPGRIDGRRVRDIDGNALRVLGLAGRHARGFRQFGMIWVATALLFVVAAIVAPSAITGSSLLAILPFVAVLAIVAVGETLVIQQRGLDFSVGGAMSLTIVIITKFPQTHSLFLAIVVSLAAVAVAGLISGFAVVIFNMPSLVATLGMNAVLAGVAQAYSGGTVTSATAALNNFMTSRPAGIPASVWIALGVVLVASFSVSRTTVGRRFVAIGANSEAVRANGTRLMWNQVGTYVAAAVCYGIAGIVYAGYLDTPAIDAGNQYLLAGVSAVVIGGTALTGGRGSIIASAVAAFFLQLLSQVIYALGASASTQYIVYAAAIAVAMALRPLLSARGPRRALGRRRNVLALETGMPADADE